MPVSQLYLESRKMPFVRLLIALAAGIVLQWYLDVSWIVLLAVFFVTLCSYLVFLFVSSYQKFRWQWLQGVTLLMMVLSAGSILCFIKNPLHQESNYTNVYKNGDAIVATVNETLISKAKTYKANVVINGIYHNKIYTPATGTVLVYFNKADLNPTLQYGSQIIFSQPLQSIKNTNNPGAFDYRRYLLFQGVTAQVYLRSNDYKILPGNKGSSFQKFLNSARSYVITTIQTYIPGRDEQSVAEALLIGYRNDLDKQLVLQYSTTGVVHIIAISGLHIGMMYGFILLLFSRFKNRRWYRFAVPVIAMIVLWLFTLLAGAVPSILRSAVTFSFVAGGMFINRKTNIYNTLAASAFCLLVFNPYLLWDVGFQLSYAAVLGIVMFIKPLANCLYVENKILNKLWQLTCVNIAAQLLTLPLVLYNFHQFPTLFLLTNLMIVPLSELILFITLFLIIVSIWSPLSLLIGKIAGALLWLMNTTITHTSRLPFSVWTGIKTDVVQTWLLYVIIVLFAVWLLFKQSRLLVIGLALSLLMLIYLSVDVWRQSHQQKLIVYNIPKHTAIDVIDSRKATCFYDDSLPIDVTANSFTIKPAHTLFRINDYRNYHLSGKTNVSYGVNGKTLLILSHALPDLASGNKLKADVVIITSNARLYITDVCKVINCKTIVADNNTSQWKLNKWKHDCDSLHIHFYSVSQQGAFIMDL